MFVKHTVQHSPTLYDVPFTSLAIKSIRSLFDSTFITLPFLSINYTLFFNIYKICESIS